MITKLQVNVTADGSHEVEDNQCIFVLFNCLITYLHKFDENR